MKIDIMRNNYSNDNNYYIVDKKEGFMKRKFHLIALL